MSNIRKFKQFSELEEAVEWMNQGNYFIISVYSTPGGVFVVYEENNDNN